VVVLLVLRTLSSLITLLTGLCQGSISFKMFIWTIDVVMGYLDDALRLS
jgi:hypothetical protein